MYYNPCKEPMPVGPMAKNYPAADARCAAIITAVHNSALVNLVVFDANGTSHGKASVPLIQPGEKADQDDGYCQWMPYQIKKSTGSESGEPAVGTQPI